MTTNENNSLSEFANNCSGPVDPLQQITIKLQFQVHVSGSFAALTYEADTRVCYTQTNKFRPAV